MLGKYIVVKTINSMLDANRKHPCGVCMCSDCDGQPFFAQVEPFVLFDTYESALTVAKKETQKMLSDIQDDVASGWSIRSDSYLVYECFKNEALESGVINPEDRVWVFSVDVQRVPVEK